MAAQALVHFDGGFQFAFHRTLFDHGIDDVGLMSGSNLLAHEFPDFVGALVADQARGDGRASGRQLVEHAGVEIAVDA